MKTFNVKNGNITELQGEYAKGEYITSFRTSKCVIDRGELDVALPNGIYLVDFSWDEEYPYEEHDDNDCCVIDYGWLQYSEGTAIVYKAVKMEE